VIVMANSKIVLTVIAATLSLGLAACETVAVRTDSAKDLSVANCHTYSFANEHVAVMEQAANSAFSNPLNAERLRGAIQTNMSIRGIQEVDRAQADCVVGYAMGSRQVLSGYYGGFYGAGWGGWGYGRRGWGWGAGWGPGWGWDGPWVDNETRISVDIFDAKTHRPIWHATASQSAYELTGPAAVEKINLAASAIFSHFPVGAPPAVVPASGASAT
jgi:Domain of unknown function (DUF4136)